MATLLIELTNRCNLSCRHCFDQRHGGHAEIPLSVIENITNCAGRHGFDRIVFTGGEPTLHSQFARIVRRVYEAGYRFGFVSNGQNFEGIYPQIKPFLDGLEIITFSLDGATAVTHDRLRGAGTFIHLLKAVSICVAKAIPFTFNSVLTRHNVGDVQALATLAQQLGSGGIRFGPLILTPSAMEHGLAIGPQTLQAVADEIKTLTQERAYPIGMAPGFYAAALFPCAALQLKEMTITHLGVVALCCHLPDHGSSLLGLGAPIDLNRVRFEAAVATWKRAVRDYRTTKEGYFRVHSRGLVEHLPCWFCHSYSGQAEWLGAYAATPWFRFIDEDNYLGRRLDD